MFQIDPLMVLRSDQFSWHIRLAAAMVVDDDWKRARKDTAEDAD